MNILITGGSTYVPIDKVRGITNIFKGKTACDIAIEALARGHNVILLGNPGMMQCVHPVLRTSLLTTNKYNTYDELYTGMHDIITAYHLDVVIHSAAVSDYKVSSIYPTPEHVWLEGKCRHCGVALNSKTEFSHCISHPVSFGKVPSSYKKLSMDLVPTEKIVDKIRDPWAFKGTLVKFKLQVDMSDDELLGVARKSRETSRANILVANCLEWARERAYILVGDRVVNVSRNLLAKILLDEIERAP